MKSSLHPKLIPDLDAKYAFVDLEVDRDGRIFHAGIVWNKAFDCRGEDISRAIDFLSDIHRVGRVHLCGHNFRRFDALHLTRSYPQFSLPPIIDTLELSVLAFPLQSRHNLSKDYKLSTYSANDPVEDALRTRQLLHDCLAALGKRPTSLLRAYAWLLTCGPTEADKAYRVLFDLRLGVPIETCPRLEDLPKSAIHTADLDYLRKFLNLGPTLSFDARLCLAGMLAWNDAFVRAAEAGDEYQAEQVYPLWLGHLSEFSAVLAGLHPVSSATVDLQAYRERFDIHQFRPPQEEAIHAVLDGQSPLIIMPTGAGKSICYQLPALALWEKQRGLSVVISPLQALMEDQVRDLHEQGIDFSTFINGTLPVKERHLRIDQVRSGEKGLLYIGPEQLRSIGIHGLFRQRLPMLWVIDEAHCISQWGHDFRPDYRYIPKFIRALYQDAGLPLPRLALMTATATDAVAQDMRDAFDAHDLALGPLIRPKTSRRDNLILRVDTCIGTKEEALLRAVEDARQHAGAVLVYTTTRKSAESLALYLTRNGNPASFYHGRLARGMKREVLLGFKSGEIDVVVATCAFGMGINRAEVRAVIHHTMSSSLEGYVQEAGRAGRDGKPAACTLLFDPNDAETIFFLKAQNHVSEATLRDVFAATRAIRKRVYGETASDAFFWATISELVMEGALTSELLESGSQMDDPQDERDRRDTKLKVALHHLETFGLIERRENLSTYLRLRMIYPNTESAHQAFDAYAKRVHLPSFQVSEFTRLIDTLCDIYLAGDHNDERYALDALSDQTGIAARDLPGRLKELEKAGICTAEVAITLLVTKGVRADARRNYERVRTHDRAFAKLLAELQADGSDVVQVHLRNAASRLNRDLGYDHVPDQHQKLGASDLTAALEGWTTRRWVSVRRINKEVVRIGHNILDEHLDLHEAVADAIVGVLYDRLDTRTGARLRVEYDLSTLVKDVNGKLGLFAVTPEEVQDELLWLHQRRIMRLADGLNLFQQALRLRVVQGANVRTIRARYHEVQAHYDEQTRRTHIMLHYGSLHDEEARMQLIDNYFRLPRAEFDRTYPDLAGEAVTRPVTPEDFTRIMGPLSPAQRAIVETEAPALAVIAGPGSGKTRTIVHRIAYLVKVKRVQPERILVLAFNRNAVNELRRRLRDLLGTRAGNVRVYTFHSLALALLGRSIAEERPTDNDLQNLLIEAADAIEQGGEADDEDVQVRRARMLGGVEHIFVDEYQDVDKDVYRLIKAVAGWEQSEDESRSVQINLCIIGDDDQGIYAFRGANSAYIRAFEADYHAKRLLLTENYRSTEPIIAAANRLITHASARAKTALGEQIQIDVARVGSGGPPVTAFSLASPEQVAPWICSQIQTLLAQGIKPGEIAVLARQWETLGPIRLLLERAGIQSQTLNQQGGVRLSWQLATCQLIKALQRDRTHVFDADSSVATWIAMILADLGHSSREPTVQTLLHVAQTLDAERGLDDEVSESVTAEDVLTALYDFESASQTFVESQAVSLGSCHSAKGLEFRAVILLTDDFHVWNNEIESERRLFYVAMTRAKEHLMLCQASSAPRRFVTEAGVPVIEASVSAADLPHHMVYMDLGMSGVMLDFTPTRQEQGTIQALREGDPLRLSASWTGRRWLISTEQGVRIGTLSDEARDELATNKITHGRFVFRPGEVRVGQIARRVKVVPLTGEIEGEWFVVLPQIRVCR